MNAKHRQEMQERRIQALSQKVEELEAENKALRKQNQEFLDAEEDLKAKMELVDSMHYTYQDALSKMSKMRTLYVQAIYRARQTEQEYRRKFKRRLREVRG